MNETTFEKKIAPILNYIGIIGATLTSIAYIIGVFVLIKGFEYHQKTQTVIFAVVNALVGLIIMQFLKVQGTAFAKTLEKNKKVIEEYYATKTKDKKNHSLTFFWITSVIKDV